MSQEMLKIALSRGRIFQETLPLLARAGIRPLEDPERSRRLILPTSQQGVSVIIVRASDVPAYVEHGGADMGVAGKDVLLEHGGEHLYEPLDLGIARCRLMVAGPEDAPPVRGRLRIATKYVRSTRRFYASRGEQVEVIKLYGSMELAPLVGMADRIVDVVDTGGTLRANGLVPIEKIADISSRLIVNRASMKTRHARIRPLIDLLARAVADSP